MIHHSQTAVTEDLMYSKFKQKKPSTQSNNSELNQLDDPLLWSLHRLESLHQLKLSYYEKLFRFKKNTGEKRTVPMELLYGFIDMIYL